MNKYSKENRLSQSFARGTFILTASVFIVKVLGMLFRILVTGKLGGEGANYFGLAYEIYSPLFALATAGLPVAVSRTVAESAANGRYKDVRTIKKVSQKIFLLTGGLAFLLMILCAFVLPRYLFKVPGAMYSVLALSPVVLFVCLMSIYRGYHQGLQDMMPTAVSEIIEAVIKLVFGFLFMQLVLLKVKSEYLSTKTFFGTPYESLEKARQAAMPFAAAAAILGIALASLVGYLYLLYVHKKRGDGITKLDLSTSCESCSQKMIAKNLVKTALPIGVTAIFLNLASLIDATVILNRIKHIMQTSPHRLLNFYGSHISQNIISSNQGGVHSFLQGCYFYTAPFLMLIIAITTAFSVVSLPHVTKSFTKNDKKLLKKSIESVMKLTCVVTFPAGVLVAVLGPLALQIIYPKSPNEVFIASRIIQILGIASIFQAISMPVCSILQAIKRVDLPAKLIAAGLVIKIVVNYFLVGVPEVNIQGAGVGTLVGFGFVLFCGLVLLNKEAKVKIDYIKSFLKPAICTTVMALAVFTVHKILYTRLNNILCLSICLFIAAIIYFMFLWLMQVLTKEDMGKLFKRKKK